jgi:hypothetical protein
LSIQKASTISLAKVFKRLLEVDPELTGIDPLPSPVFKHEYNDIDGQTSVLPRNITCDFEGAHAWTGPGNNPAKKVSNNKTMKSFCD